MPPTFDTVSLDDPDKFGYNPWAFTTAPAAVAAIADVCKSLKFM